MLKLAKCILSFAIVAVISASAFAAVPPVPDVKTAGYINGKMNIAVWYKTSAYNNTSGSELTCSYLIEMKDSGEDAWTDVTSRGVFNKFVKNSYVFQIWTMPTNYIGLAEFRIRSVDSSTKETSEWVELGPSKFQMNVKGKVILGTNCYGNGFDGFLHTIEDATGDSGNNKYIGYVFDEPTRIKAIRFVPRLDHSALSTRYRNSVFQIASDETFSDATTVYTVSATFSNINITEVVFDEPVTAKAIRHYKELAGYESSAEVEFIPADMPLKPSLTVDCDELTNFNAKATWSLPEDFMCATCRLERAINKDGPWVAQTEWLDPKVDTLSLTNKDLYVGIPYYYRVAAITKHPQFEDTCVYSKVVEYTRLRRLDRSWDDETKLFDGITVMVATNGTVLNTNTREGYRAFDGEAKTFPDLTQDHCYHGPVGLDFGESVWVKKFGYVCRNDNACYSRIRFAALFSSNSGDYELKDKVQRSGNPTQYSQDTTFYTCDATLASAEGARKWFLYQTDVSTSDRFYGNVAELAFFGYTQTDIDAAPIVTAPVALSFARGETGPVVTWTKGNHVEAYTLKRRLRGASEWTALATFQNTVLSHTETNLDQGVYEYCIIADGGELGTATSDVFTCPWYVSGNGTGLSSVTMWPYLSTSILPGQLTSSVARGIEAVNLDLGPTEEIAAGVSSFAHTVWEGTLIVPFDGTYTFTADVIGGAAVAIDDAFVINSWEDGKKVLTGDVPLTAGEHFIRVDYHMDHVETPAKKLILKWSGPILEEVIPASQLVASQTPPSSVLDGWKCISYNMNTVGRFEKIDNSYRITASKESVNEAPLKASFMNRKMSGSYEFETYLDRGNTEGDAGIMIQGEDGYYIMVYIRIIGGDSYYGARVYAPGNESWQQLADNVQFGNSSNFDSYLRVEKRGREIKCCWKDLVDDPWTEVATYNAPLGMFGPQTAVGVTVNGRGGTVSSAQYVFRDMKLAEIDSPTIILVR